MNAVQIPEGYKADARGNLVRLENIREIDIARDEFVNELIDKSKALNAYLAKFKHSAMADINAFVSLSAERYGVKMGGAKGNITLSSFDGKRQIKLAISDTLAFDEGLQAAKSLIDECLNEWTEGSRPEIHALINEAFDVDKEGKINTQRVLSLRRLDIEDEKWQRAMSALSDSLRVQCSKSYIRIYEQDENGKYQQISLDMANL